MNAKGKKNKEEELVGFWLAGARGNTASKTASFPTTPSLFPIWFSISVHQWCCS